MRKLALLLVLFPLASFAQTPRVINMTMTANPWRITPSSFTVNQGDIVTLNVSVPANDFSVVGHAFLMATYVQNDFAIRRGETHSVTFTATTAGTFAFVCTQSACGAGHSSMFGQMIVTGAGPAINAVSPASGPTSGGTIVTIGGSGFQSGATVKFGNLDARSTTFIDSTLLTATTPIGPTSEQVAVPLDVIVRNPDGTTATKASAFTYVVPPLTVTTVTPSTGSAGTVVTILGTGFTSALSSSVSFGGVDATNVRILDAVTIQATAPPHALGAVDVAVRMGSNTFTRPTAFTYIAVRRRTVRH